MTSTNDIYNALMAPAANSAGSSTSSRSGANRESREQFGQYLSEETSQTAAVPAAKNKSSARAKDNSSSDETAGVADKKPGADGTGEKKEVTSEETTAASQQKSDKSSEIAAKESDSGKENDGNSGQDATPAVSAQQDAAHKLPGKLDKKGQDPLASPQDILDTSLTDTETGADDGNADSDTKVAAGQAEAGGEKQVADAGNIGSDKDGADAASTETKDVATAGPSTDKNSQSPADDGKTPDSTSDGEDTFPVSGRDVAGVDDKSSETTGTSEGQTKDSDGDVKDSAKDKSDNSNPEADRSAEHNVSQTEYETTRHTPEDSSKKDKTSDPDSSPEAAVVSSAVGTQTNTRAESDTPQAAQTASASDDIPAQTAENRGNPDQNNRSDQNSRDARRDDSRHGAAAASDVKSTSSGTGSEQAGQGGKTASAASAAQAARTDTPVKPSGEQARHNLTQPVDSLASKTTLSTLNLGMGHNLVVGTQGLTAQEATSAHMLHTSGTVSSNSALSAQAAQAATEQVFAAISRQMNGGTSTFKIQLHPADLGKVDVKMDFAADGKVITTLTVDNEKTLHLLQRDQNALGKMLENAGLDMSQNNLNYNLRQQTGNGSGFTAGDNSHTAGDAVPIEDETIPAEVLAVNVSDSGLDISV